MLEEYTSFKTNVHPLSAPEDLSLFVLHFKCNICQNLKPFSVKRTIQENQCNIIHSSIVYTVLGVGNL